MLFSICVQWLRVGGNCVCVCVFEHWDWRQCQSARLDHSQGTKSAAWTFWHNDGVRVCCECRKTPILAAIKRSISIVLKLAFSLRFSFETPLLHLFTLAAMLRCCYTIATKSSLHFWICTFVVSFCHCVFSFSFFFSLSVWCACVLFAAREWQFGFSYFISSKEHWH